MKLTAQRTVQFGNIVPVSSKCS